jgi:hypothetical protein
LVYAHRDHGKLDATTLKAFKEILPTHKEQTGLSLYMTDCLKEAKPAGNTEEAKAAALEEARNAAYTDLSECEKYMITMMNVDDASAKIDCLLFRSQYQVKFTDLVEAIQSIEKACDEVKSSERLREILVVTLALLNEISGDENGATGFNLDALLKLNEVRRL